MVNSLADIARREKKAEDMLPDSNMGRVHEKKTLFSIHAMHAPLPQTLIYLPSLDYCRSNTCEGLVDAEVASVEERVAGILERFQAGLAEGKGEGVHRFGTRWGLFILEIPMGILLGFDTIFFYHPLKDFIIYLCNPQETSVFRFQSLQNCRPSLQVSKMEERAADANQVLESWKTAKKRM